jgi:hypothetical protein
MNRSYSRQLHKNLPFYMAKADFEPLDVPMDERHSPGSRVFVCKKYLPMWFFLEVYPSFNGNEFYVQWGWSALGRFINTPSALKHARESQDQLMKYPEMADTHLTRLGWRPNNQSPYLKFKLEYEEPWPTFMIDPNTRIIEPPEQMKDVEQCVKYVLEGLIAYLNEHKDWMFEQIQSIHTTKK